MSKFNHYARELDIAFSTTRNELDEIRKKISRAEIALNTANASGDSLRQRYAALDLEALRGELDKRSCALWAKFDSKCAELTAALKEDIRKESVVDPAAVDANAVELLKSGVLSVDDFYSLADKYSGNAAMQKLIAHYAKQAAESESDRTNKAALSVLAAECINGRNNTVRAWETLVETANYCSGRGGNGMQKRTPEAAALIGQHWETLSAETVKNF